MRTECLCVSVLRVASGPRMKLVDCKSALTPPPPPHTHTRFILLTGLRRWSRCCSLGFILRGDSYKVLHCVLSICFSVLLPLQQSRLGKRELLCMFFVRLFGLLVLVCVSFLFLLVSGIAATFDCDTPWTFLFTFLLILIRSD